MNQYGSINRVFCARNVAEAQISPPSDLVLKNADFTEQVFNDGNWQAVAGAGACWYPGANLILHRIGLFSNFADGLVFKTMENRLGIRINAYPYDLAAGLLTGTMKWPANSKTVTGVGTTFNTEVSAGDFIRFNSNLGNPPIVGRVVSVDPGGLLMTMSDYGPGAPAGSTARKLNLLGGQSVSTMLYGINTLHHMFEHERFIPASVLAGNLPYFLLTAQVVLSTGSDPAAALQECVFLTKSIDTAFARETAYFDIMAEFEVTANLGLTV